MTGKGEGRKPILTAELAEDAEQGKDEIKELRVKVMEPNSIQKPVSWKRFPGFQIFLGVLCDLCGKCLSRKEVAP